MPVDSLDCAPSVETNEQRGLHTVNVKAGILLLVIVEEQPLSFERVMTSEEDRRVFRAPPCSYRMF